MSTWRQTTLGMLIELQRGHDLTEVQRTAGTVPVIGSAGQNGWHNVARSKGPGVTIGRSGASAGVVTYVCSDYWPHNTALYVKDFKGNHPLFMAYLLRTLPLAELNSGAAQPSLNRNFLYPLPVHAPDPIEQQRIAEILGAYDDLIDVNRQRVTLLEDMARGLFQEWFARFRFPGHEDVALVETANGPVPEDWAWKTVGDVTAYINRGIAPRYDASVSTLVVGQKCVRNQRVGLALARTQSKAVPADKLVRDLDVLVNSTGVGTLGRVGQIEVAPEGLTVDSHVTIARAARNIDPDWFGLSMLAKEAIFEALGTGSTGQTELSRASIAAQPLLLPAGDLAHHFGGIVRPMRSLVHSLQIAQLDLAASRDLLLPRLISGQLSVTEGERELAQAA